MLFDGVKIIEGGGDIENAVVASGAIFPVSPNLGELFYKTGASAGLHVYDGTAWAAAGSGGTFQVTGDMTGTIGEEPNALTLATVNSAPGAFGGASTVPVIQVNAKGLVITSTDTPIQITESQITDGTIYTRLTGNELISGSWSFQSAVSGVSPTAAQHLATKDYVDTVLTGLTPHETVRVASTGQVVLTGLQTIDGVTVANGDRVLVKNQSTASQNGVYIANPSAWTRASDFDGSPTVEVSSGDFVYVLAGTTNGGTGWVLTTQGTITVGSTGLTFTQLSSATGISYQAGSGLSLIGNTFAVTSAPANSLSGTTLAANVTNSSLTSVGTLSTLTIGGAAAFGTVITETTVSVTSTATTTLNCGLGNIFAVLLDANITSLVFTNVPTAGRSYSASLFVTQGSGGSRTITWPASIQWIGAIPPILSTAAGLTDVITLITQDGGATWIGLTADAAVAPTAAELAGTTLASNIVNSSLTSVGTLASLTVTGNVTAADPTLAAHLATKLYVDNLVTGLTWKTAARVATTANITLSGTQTIDVIAVVAGDRVLVKNQTTAAQNGVYIVAAGAWTRATDFDASPSVGEVNGAAIFVRQGTVNAETAWTQTAEVVTIGTDAMVFTIFSATGGAVAKTGDTMSGDLVLTSARVRSSGADLQVEGANGFNLLFNTGGTERMRIDSTGNIGIGIAPTARLTINSAGSAVGTVTNISQLSGSIRLFGTVAGQCSDGISWNSAGGGGAAITFSRGGGFDSNIHFYTNASAGVAGATTERMVIQHNGTVLIGKSVDDISGTNGWSLSGNGAHYSFQIASNEAFVYNNRTAGTTYSIAFRTQNAARGSIVVSDTATAYNTSSDERLKHDIVNAPSAIDKVKAMQVRSFKWNVDDSKVEHGFIAQELNQVEPLAVTQGDTWAVDPSKLVATLTKALQEALNRVETLEAAQTAMLARLSALEE